MRGENIEQYVRVCVLRLKCSNFSLSLFLMIVFGTNIFSPYCHLFALTFRDQFDENATAPPHLG